MGGDNTAMLSKCVIATLALVITVVSPSTIHGQTIPYTRHSLRAAMRSAHTANEYGELARYFRERSIALRKLSDEQERILRQQVEHPAVSSKYPTSADQTRRFREHYSEESGKAWELSERYAALASSAPLSSPTE